jgi:hypothetical protein
MRREARCEVAANPEAQKGESPSTRAGEGLLSVDLAPRPPGRNTPQDLGGSLFAPRSGFGDGVAHRRVCRRVSPGETELEIRLSQPPTSSKIPPAPSAAPCWSPAASVRKHPRVALVGVQATGEARCCACRNSPENRKSPTCPSIAQPPALRPPEAPDSRSPAGSPRGEAVAAEGSGRDARLRCSHPRWLRVGRAISRRWA